MKKIRRYCPLLWLCLGMGALVFGLLGYRFLDRKIPDEITVTEENRDKNLLPSIPFLTLEDAIPVSGEGSFCAGVKYLGVIPLKTVKVTEKESTRVYVSGSSVGIYMETEGVLIVDTGEIISPSGTAQEPAKNIVEAGDYILAFNEKEVSTKKELMEDLSELDGEEVTLAVRRGSEVLNLSITPVQDAGGNYRLGIWVRDDTQGIGTLTFVTMDGQFGALGHGISDVDTAQLLAVREGSLYGSTILGIRKGSSGNPGELSGLIRYESANCLGTITGNTELGIFGMLDLDSRSALSLTELPLGCKQEMETGEASILCDVDGQVEEYEVEITRIDMGSADTNKSFVLTVTDEELLEKTGGIIQGMSGSPVIQNGKFVGAVTHVFVQDVTSGYGIFAETMLEQLEEKNGGDSVEEGKNVA